LQDLSYVYLAMGEMERTMATNREAVGYWRQLRNQAMLANSLAVEGNLLAEAGEYAASLAASDEGYQLSEAINNWWGMAFNRINMGPVHWDRGDLALALAVSRAVIEHARRAGFIIPLFVVPAFLADMYGELGAVTLALTQLAEAEALQAPIAHMYQPLLRAVEIRVYLANGQAAAALALAEAQPDLMKGVLSYYSRGSMNYLLGVVPAVRSEIALLRGRPGEALAVTEEAEALAQHLARRPMAEILYWRGRAQQALGDREAAGVTLGRARAQAEKVGQQRLLWRILAVQAELAAQAGRLAEAEALLGQARAILANMADRAGSPELRASFLARPAVRAVLP
jgi:tetratricopeptide (TPR) repeat protein